MASGCATCLAALVLVGAPAPPPATPIALASAIEAFNARALDDPIGREQPPLTESEVVAVIRLSTKKDFSEAPEPLFEAFRKIAETRELPAGAEFEVLTGLDPGGPFLFDVWYVRIMFPKPDGGSFSFSIRQQVVGSKSVAIVARDLEKKLAEIPPLPGRHRLEERVKELKARAAAETAPKEGA